MQDASVNSLKAMDIVSQDDPSFTDQFMELLPNLKIKFTIHNIWKQHRYYTVFMTIAFEFKRLYDEDTYYNQGKLFENVM